MTSEITRRKLTSWGATKSVDSIVHNPQWICDVPEVIGKTNSNLANFGAGMSYGDVCLSIDETISTKNLDNLIQIDSDSKTIECESGMTIGELIRCTIPRGFFPFVVPGTQEVTIGGAIANDIHGKNHHIDGSFGCFLESLVLVRSDGVFTCSRDLNSDLFYATIGGMGLTGTIISAKLRLNSIQSTNIEVETKPFNSMEEFLDFTQINDQTHQYTVAWLDSSNFTETSLRGILYLGKHSRQGNLELLDDTRIHKLPIASPSFLNSSTALKLLNKAYYVREESKSGLSLQDYTSFFFPLDKVKNWNKYYGKKGFYQFQCLLPLDKVNCIPKILKRIHQSHQGSFVSVLKRMGSIRSGGILSFPSEGITLALDIANFGNNTNILLKNLNDMTIEAGGKLYAAKDATMSNHHYLASYGSEIEQFLPFKDPKYNSQFWQRCVEGTAK